jgi:rubrerythrin
MGIKALDKAIEFEKEGIKFYSNALKIIQHDLCRKLIQTLLEEEKKHIDELNKIYNELDKNGSWPEVDTVVVDDQLKNIYKNACAASSKTLMPSSDEREFLDLCMALEIKAQKQYKKLADEAEDEKEKKFYERLFSEEEKHYEFLEQHYNYYWDSGLKMQE